MKKFLYSLFVILIFASAVFADPQTFGNFRAEIPSNWTGELQNSTLIIKNENKNASISIEFHKIGEASLSEIVENLCTKMDGRDLEQDDDGDYSFSFVNSDGIENIALVTCGDDYYLLIFMNGFEDNSLEKDFEKILHSIDWEE